MANELIINASLPETRIALMENGEIQELLIERASGKGIVGNIYKGRVTRVLPGMQAAFVDIGLEKAAFLYVDDVYVHSEVWEEEEGGPQLPSPLAEAQAPEGEQPKSDEPVTSPDASSNDLIVSEPIYPSPQEAQSDRANSSENLAPTESDYPVSEAASDLGESSEGADAIPGDPADDEDDEDDDRGSPAEMGADPNESSGSSDDASNAGGDDSDAGERNSKNNPEGTIAPEQDSGEKSEASAQSSSDGEDDSAASNSDGSSSPARRRHRRGRRGGKFKSRRNPTNATAVAAVDNQSAQRYPETFHEQVADSGQSGSDRSGMDHDALTPQASTSPTAEAGRPEEPPRDGNFERRPNANNAERNEFRSQRSRDRRIRAKTSSRPARAQVNIQDLLKEGQEVLVQVAKDPIATKGARLTCHISLPGRHLVCMPTIDHVGVSRRIEREDERRRLREYVERNRPRNLGFIVRTASGKQQSEKRIKQDIDYLTRLWTEIKEKSGALTAPALVYEDLNSVLRAIRDWVTEEIDKVIVDSRYHYNDILRFVSHFMPPLKQKVELYHGDIPIFDAYGISTELSRALERKVWLKSGGYIVIDQAEALVAIDVNTGRYVGKKNLEDTILKTNLEAVQEIAYQLRLRNCGGIIILDLIDMEKDENKQRVYRALEDALSRDRARPTILKISELGLVEMTRKRTRDTIIRTLCESCTHCEGKGFIKSKQTVAYEVLREIEREGIERDVSKILVQAHPEVIDILAIDERETLDQLERRYRKVIYLQAVNDFHSEQFEVTADKKDRPERDRDRDRPERNRERDQSEQTHERGRNRNRNRQEAPVITPRESTNSAEPAQSPVIVPVSQAAIAPVEKDSQQGSGEVSQTDPDNIGNRANSTIIANNTPAAQASVPAPAVQPAAQNDEFFDEEDRLAFLRAQAAQDAALARLNNGAGPTVARAPSENSGRNNAGANRRGTRGKRGGKFRRGADRPRDRKPYNNFNQKKEWTEGPKEPGTPVTMAAPSTPPRTTSGNNDDNGGSSGGAVGGDQLQNQW